MNILIVKHGAMGDVLRTTPFLTAYKRLYPGCRVTWIVDAVSAPVLEHNPSIDRLIVYSPEALRELASECFDLAINLDKEKEALDSIEAARASVKQGFVWNADKTAVTAADGASDYALRLGVDDDLKFRKNRKSYQEISFEQAGIRFGGEEYVFSVSDTDRVAARRHLAAVAGAGPYIGINTGSGDRFAGKRLPEAAIAELARIISPVFKSKILLLGGPREHERNAAIERLAHPHAINAGTNHSIHRFAAIVAECALVVTGDTIAMHVAIAMKVPVVAFFGSTCAPEIELYGRGRKIVSALPCAPCYKRDCPLDDKEKCMTDISPETILEEARRVLEPAARAENAR